MFTSDLILDTRFRLRIQSLLLFRVMLIYMVQYWTCYFFLFEMSTQYTILRHREIFFRKMWDDEVTNWDLVIS